MPVSFFQEATFPCPRCGREVQARVALVVHAEEHPDLVDAARRGNLHRVTCPACGHTTEVDAPLLLYFPRAPKAWGLEDDGPVALFAPARGTTPEEDRQTLQALLEHLARDLGQPVETLAGRLLPVPPDALAAVLEKGPAHLLETLAQAAQQALEELREQDPEAYQQLEDAARQMWETLAQAAQQALQEHPALRGLLALAEMENLQDLRRVVQEHPALLQDEHQEAVQAFLAWLRSTGEEGTRFAEALEARYRALREAARQAREMGLSLEAALQMAALMEREDIENLLQALQRFLTAPTWAETRRVLEAHPELLSDAALALLERLLEEARQQRDADLVRLLEQHRDLLRRAREVGLDRAFAEMTGPSLPPQLQPLVQRAQEAQARYLRTRDLQALDEAVAAWEAVLNHPALEEADLRTRLAVWNDAAGTFLRRYWARGNPQDLDRALDLWQRAVALTPEGSPDLPGYLNNLGNGLSDRYARTGNLQDLEEAIEVSRRAVALTPEGSPDLPGRLNNLGTGLRDRYARTGNLQDLEEAIRAYRRAVALTPEGSPDLPALLNNLGNGLRDRYVRTGNLQDLEEAIRAYRRAVALTPEGSPDLPGRLNNLGTGLRDRYARTGNLQDLEEAIRAWQRAISLGRERHPEAALTAARTWTLFAFQHRPPLWEDVDRAARAGLQVVQDLLAAQAGREAKRAWLREAQDLPARHAYALVRLGRLREAVEALEAGRAFLLREAFERRRKDLERLPELGFPDLYRAYREAEGTLVQLEAMPPEARPTDWFARRREALQALEDAARTIREQVGARYPEFRFFLRSLPYTEVQRLAAEAGPLVYLLATEHGGLALLVPPQGEPQAVELPDLTEAALRTKMGGYLDAYRRWLEEERSEQARGAWFRALEETLTWLGRALAPLLSKVVDSGEWSVVSGQWTADRRPPTAHCRPPTADCAPPPTHPPPHRLAHPAAPARGPAAGWVVPAGACDGGLCALGPRPVPRADGPGGLPAPAPARGGEPHARPALRAPRGGRGAGVLPARCPSTSGGGTGHGGGRAKGPAPGRGVPFLGSRPGRLGRSRKPAAPGRRPAVPFPNLRSASGKDAAGRALRVRNGRAGPPGAGRGAGPACGSAPGRGAGGGGFPVGGERPEHRAAHAALLPRVASGRPARARSPAGGPGVDAPGLARGKADLPARPLAGIDGTPAAGGRAPSSLCLGCGTALLPALPGRGNGPPLSLGRVRLLRPARGGAHEPGRTRAAPGALFAAGHGPPGPAGGLHRGGGPAAGPGP